MNLPVKIFALIFIILLSSISCAGNKSSADEQQALSNLSTETTELLNEEMWQLQNDMKKIVPALVSGKWDEIAEIGRRMEGSYIMKESLTKAQMHELHETLPEHFQKLDKFFHESAGLLAQSADQKKPEQVSYYYFKMTEACVECHTTYATHKFPEFIKQ